MNRRTNKRERLHIESTRGTPVRGRGKKQGRGRGRGRGRGQKAVNDVYELSKKSNKSWM